MTNQRPSLLVEETECSSARCGIQKYKSRKHSAKAVKKPKDQGLYAIFFQVSTKNVAI